MRRQRSNCGLRCLVPKPQWICGRQSKSSPSLHSLGFFFHFWCEIYKPLLDLAKHNSSPLQYVYSNSRNLLRGSQAEFEARKREKKIQTSSYHTPCSFLIAFLVAHQKRMGERQDTKVIGPVINAAKEAACESE